MVVAFTLPFSVRIALAKRQGFRGISQELAYLVYIRSDMSVNTADVRAGEGLRHCSSCIRLHPHLIGFAAASFSHGA
jgi:hypothetical protein